VRYIQFVCLTKLAVVFLQLQLLVLHFAGNDFPRFLIFPPHFFLYVAKLQNVESRRRIKYVEKQLAGAGSERPQRSSTGSQKIGL